ncbi:hypothetical protein QR680_006687 [Steinernema hermaphroditum]|uniref:Transmembrane protein n=1 Tax=Steinernema hermaphroditum TaxID=289476 RepID=A0AA39LWX8_9BILA|nr:hypothetical protein QR680_006687 [Steinernema hermaphroditum]
MVHCNEDYETCQEKRDMEICHIGWVLLALWIGMIIYISREIWPCTNGTWPIFKSKRPLPAAIQEPTFEEVI